MIRFRSGRLLYQILSSIEVRNPPTGEAHDHIRLRMLDVDAVEIATQVPGRWALWRHCHDVEGDPGEVILASPSLVDVVRSMAGSESITLRPDPEGLDVVQGLQEVDGKTILQANRIVGVYCDDPQDFQLPAVPEQLLARVEGKALRDALGRLIKFAAYGTDDTRTCLLRVEPGYLTFIAAAKDAEACLLAIRVPAEHAQTGTWVMRGPALSYWKVLAEGEVALYANPQTLALLSDLGGAVVDVPPLNRLLEARSVLFDHSGPQAPIPLGRRIVDIQQLISLLKTQLPPSREPDSYRRNLVLHPYRGGLWIYRPGRPRERAIVRVQGLDEESRLVDLATEFFPVAVNGPALLAAAVIFLGYARGGRDAQTASLVTLQQVYTVRRPSGARVLIIRMFPAGDTDPQLCVALIGDNPDEVPDLDDVD